VRLTAAQFERLMQPFEPFEKNPMLAVAVSGGRDSLALALLARDWASARGGKVIAMIVDHGLRAASAREVTTTRKTLSALGIDAEALRWLGAKPKSGIQQAARGARYRLLAEACRARGVLHLLIAHHADDQAETIAMRAARDSGADGLAGMAALVETPDLRLLRPLLPLPRAALTATLDAANVAWIDDPSNVDPRFERARLRESGVVPTEATRAAERRRAAEARLAKASVGALEAAEGGIALDRSAFVRLSAGLRQRLLSRVVQAIGGGDHPPNRVQLARAVERLAGPVERGKSGRGADFTLAACRLSLRQSGRKRLRWLIRPEKDKNGGQPLVPAAFFGCGASAAHHVD
jgi:tRNA(Ile)-lysidine synthase